jgi:hypothetical protein
MISWTSSVDSLNNVSSVPAAMVPDSSAKE